MFGPKKNAAEKGKVMASKVAILFGCAVFAATGCEKQPVTCVPVLGSGLTNQNYSSSKLADAPTVLTCRTAPAALSIVTKDGRKISDAASGGKTAPPQPHVDPPVSLEPKTPDLDSRPNPHEHDRNKNGSYGHRGAKSGAAAAASSGGAAAAAGGAAAAAGNGGASSSSPGAAAAAGAGGASASSGGAAAAAGPGSASSSAKGAAASASFGGASASSGG